MKLNLATIKSIQAHAQAEYPNESCGLLVGGQYMPMNNISDTPRDNFAMSRVAWPLSDNVQAVIHSHTNGNPDPSLADMEGQKSCGIPWGLLTVDQSGHASTPYFWGDSVDIDYIGRTWRHGPTGTDNGGDCYALIRDWYRREKSVLLPDFSRDPSWIENGDDFFVKNFAALKFDQISESQIQMGDIFLMAINSGGVSNHCGIYLGSGLGLHHLMNRLSRTDPLPNWRKFITHWLRYTG
jgi:proteasome lid subunit RPN8/RPN11